MPFLLCRNCGFLDSFFYLWTTTNIEIKVRVLLSALFLGNLSVTLDIRVSGIPWYEISINKFLCSTPSQLPSNLASSMVRS